MGLNQLLILLGLYIFLSVEIDHTLVWISFDGFPHTFFSEKNSPNMYKFAKNGVFGSNGMLSSFLTATFPNHFTQATGLDVENHGIIANRFIDENGEWFSQDSRDQKWWDPDTDRVPIWIANQLSNTSRGDSAVIYWVGSYIQYKNTFPKFYHDQYKNLNGKDILSEVKDLLKKNEYSLIMAYIHDIDDIGHLFGPDSNEFITAIKSCDNLFGDFVAEVNKISPNISIMVTSDHGMKEISKSKVANINEITDVKFTTILQGPVGLFNSDHNEEQIKKMVSDINKAAGGRFIAYSKADLPREYRYSKNKRIPDVIVIGLDGWCIQGSKNNESIECKSKGGHGYPNLIEPQMSAIFLAGGKLFPKSSEVKSIKATDLYPWVCEILGIKDSCGPSDGTIPVITQVVIPKPKPKSKMLFVILGLGLVISLIIGLIFYWVRRKRNLRRTREYFQIDPLLTTEDSEEIFDLDY